MQIGMVGLGRMGANMMRRLMHDGHECVVFESNPASVTQLVQGGRDRRQQPARIGGKARDAAQRMDHGAGRTSPKTG